LRTEFHQPVRKGQPLRKSVRRWKHGALLFLPG
jgi:hypothetical protein